MLNHIIEPNLHIFAFAFQIKKATEDLLRYRKNKPNANPMLMSEDENMFLLVTLWKIPPEGKEIRIPLPHGIRPDSKDICLFTKDDPNLTSEETEIFYKQLFQKKGITSITEIIPFTRLKRQFKTYKTMRRLVSSFDLFLADQRITRLLFSHLGKLFVRRKKVPLAVNLSHRNLSQHINRIVQGTTLTVTNQGSLNTTRVGHIGMPVDHLVENIVAAIDVLSEKLPEKWDSVKFLHLKTEKSLSIPIFPSFDSHLDSPQKSENQKQSKKVSFKPAQTAVRPESECGLDGYKLEPAKESKTEPYSSKDEILQVVPVQGISPQKCLEKVALFEEYTGENFSPETQAKTPGKKRKASIALDTAKQVNKSSTQLKTTPDVGKDKKSRTHPQESPEEK
uniref:Ribosomal L1 domain containing 1 n=1 Tax=Monodelphis domestica TaxID=13616 RepID=F6UNR4_MONDO